MCVCTLYPAVMRVYNNNMRIVLSKKVILIICNMPMTHLSRMAAKMRLMLILEFENCR